MHADALRDLISRSLETDHAVPNDHAVSSFVFQSVTFGALAMRCRTAMALGILAPVQVSEDRGRLDSSMLTPCWLDQAHVFF